MFDTETTRFLTELAANNNRDWFKDNRARYDGAVAGPAKAFADVFGAELERRHQQTITPRLFRIHRDVRFSKDKTPYNTHIHMAWRVASAPLWWMVGIELDRVVIGYGCFGFDKAKLEQWRQRIAGPEGEALTGILDMLVASGARMEEPELKRVPSPFGADHPRGDLLRRKSLAVWHSDLPVQAAYGEAAPGQLAHKMAEFDSLHHWVTKTL